MRIQKAICTTTAFSILIASGCSSQSTSTEIPVKEAPVALAPAELNIYSTSGWTEEAFNDRFGNAIRKQFPQHKINYIQRKAGAQYDDLIASNTPIDMVWDSIANFSTGPMNYNMQYDMTELIKKHDVNTSAIEPTLLQSVRELSEGKLYALPVVNNTLVMFYNKSIFDKFGVPYLKDGMTCDEITEVSQKLTRSDSGVQYVGLGMPYSTFVRLNQFSVPYVDAQTETPTINTNEKWKNVFDILLKQAAIPGYSDIVRSEKKIPDVNSFIKGYVGMLATLSNQYLTQGVSDLNWDTVSLPSYKEAPGVGPQHYPTLFGVSAISKHKDQAMEIIKYLVSDEYQLGVSKSGALPVVTKKEIVDAYGQDTPYKDKNLKAAFYNKYAATPPVTKYDTNVQSVYFNTEKGMQLILGETDMNTMLRTMEEEAIKAIAEAKAKAK
ncbi:extracellular solute-binding protein [Paenibacillus hemerocallicola]|uniref:Extracellular solute-binding protein n=1 Tax=Paenibacillus hemerocallicola TaxID=1172614 RepID=A0A5C4SY11_9BACL|nr:extracellular solute-binding protein [Paenibacillus hemerocallicola]TNJ61378.1 extracellular solute-binding protein [Paenibacillus hemerocallicola]